MNRRLKKVILRSHIVDIADALHRQAIAYERFVDLCERKLAFSERERSERIAETAARVEKTRRYQSQITTGHTGGMI